MNTPLDFVTTYFTEEKIESLFFIIIGSITVLLALTFLLIIKYSLFKGLAIPLLLVGIMQLMVGCTIYRRTTKDIIQVELLIKKQSQYIQNNEIPRMEVVLKDFVIYKWIEISFMIIGFILIMVFYKSPQTFWKGLGLGLLIQASLMLCLDLIAKQRGEIYIQFLLKTI